MKAAPAEQGLCNAFCFPKLQADLMHHWFGFTSLCWNSERVLSLCRSWACDKSGHVIKSQRQPMPEVKSHPWRHRLQLLLAASLTSIELDGAAANLYCDSQEETLLVINVVTSCHSAVQMSPFGVCFAPLMAVF